MHTNRTLPNVFGGVAGVGVGVYSGCSGQLFAFSGLDGPTHSTSNFVATFASADSFDLRFCLHGVTQHPASAVVRSWKYLRFELESPRDYQFKVATNDVVVAHKQADSHAQFVLAWASWDMLIGSLPPGGDAHLGTSTGAVLTATPPDEQVVGLTGSSASAINCSHCATSAGASLVLCIHRKPTATLFALAHTTSSSLNETVRRVVGRVASSDALALGPTKAARLAWIASAPRLETRELHPFDRLLLKAVSVMRVNTLAPEANGSLHWATPSRSPHGNRIFLWDSCFQSAAQSELNHTLGWELLLTMLSLVQPSGIAPLNCYPPPGAACAMPRHGALPDITQPPLLGWATWQNFVAAVRQDDKPAGLERLRIAVPLLTAQLNWVLTHRSRRARGTGDGRDGARDGVPLLFWMHMGEAGMDNSPRISGEASSAIDLSVLVAREAAYLARMYNALQEHGASRHWAALGRNLTARIHAELWDEARGLYYDRRFNLTTGVHGPFDTTTAVTGLYALMLDDVPAPRRRSMLAALEDPTRFGTAAPVPTLAAADPRFGIDMWNGPMWRASAPLPAIEPLPSNPTAPTLRAVAGSRLARPACRRVPSPSSSD